MAYVGSDLWLGLSTLCFVFLPIILFRNSSLKRTATIGPGAVESAILATVSN